MGHYPKTCLWQVALKECSGKLKRVSMKLLPVLGRRCKKQSIDDREVLQGNVKVLQGYSC